MPASPTQLSRHQIPRAYAWAYGCCAVAFFGLFLLLTSILLPAPAQPMPNQVSLSLCAGFCLLLGGLCCYQLILFPSRSVEVDTNGIRNRGKAWLSWDDIHGFRFRREFRRLELQDENGRSCVFLSYHLPQFTSLLHTLAANTSPKHSDLLALDESLKLPRQRWRFLVGYVFFSLLFLNALLSLADDSPNYGGIILTALFLLSIHWAYREQLKLIWVEDDTLHIQRRSGLQKIRRNEIRSLYLDFKSDARRALAIYVEVESGPGTQQHQLYARGLNVVPAFQYLCNWAGLSRHKEA